MSGDELRLPDELRPADGDAWRDELDAEPRRRPWLMTVVVIVVVVALIALMGGIVLVGAAFLYI